MPSGELPGKKTRDQANLFPISNCGSGPCKFGGLSGVTDDLSTCSIAQGQGGRRPILSKGHTLKNDLGYNKA